MVANVENDFEMTLGMVGDSSTVLREVALLFLVEKAVFPRRWMSMRYSFFMEAMWSEIMDIEPW